MTLDKRKNFSLQNERKRTICVFCSMTNDDVYIDISLGTSTLVNRFWLNSWSGVTLSRVHLAGKQDWRVTLKADSLSSLNRIDDQERKCFSRVSSPENGGCQSHHDFLGIVASAETSFSLLTRWNSQRRPVTQLSSFFLFCWKRRGTNARAKVGENGWNSSFLHHQSGRAGIVKRAMSTGKRRRLVTEIRNVTRRTGAVRSGIVSSMLCLISSFRHHCH